MQHQLSKSKYAVFVGAGDFTSAPVDYSIFKTCSIMGAEMTQVLVALAEDTHMVLLIYVVAYNYL